MEKSKAAKREIKCEGGRLQSLIGNDWGGPSTRYHTIFEYGAERGCHGETRECFQHKE